jgi:methylthioribose-1-phosphate isomerase
MNVNGQAFRAIWRVEESNQVWIIDQTELPHRFVTRELQSLDDAAHAISAMLVRGAPLIGATAAYGLALALKGDPGDANLDRAIQSLLSTRPTAVNLRWALERTRSVVAPLDPADRARTALSEADRLADEDVAINEAIGTHGLAILEKLAAGKKGDRPLNILTHCNAGWLATVDWGTALAPVYKAHDAGIAVHVWVDETRPRNQGAALTAWELESHGVPHTLVVDNAGGHLMQHGRVDACIVGTDRTAASGDVCNKIGTYLKALAAADNGVPFYVALPSPTIDWTISEGSEIPIEERDSHEITHVRGRTASGDLAEVLICPPNTTAGNFAFDVTPSRLVTGLITERGLCPASLSGLKSLYP